MNEKIKLIQIAKKHKLYKTLIITVNVIRNRRALVDKNINDTLQYITDFYIKNKEEKYTIEWLKEWSNYLNYTIKRENVSTLDIITGNVKL